MFNDDTYPSGHIGVGLGCHIYVDTTTKVIRGIHKCETTEVINDQIKCERLTIVRRIDVWAGLDRICLTITRLSGHIGLGLGCHIYVDTTTRVISGLFKCETTKVTRDLIQCELLTRVRRIDVRIGFDQICLTTTHVFQDILDCG